MTSIALEAELTEEERAVRETVHKFAEEVMRPAGIELDRRHEAADAAVGLLRFGPVGGVVVPGIPTGGGHLANGDVAAADVLPE